MARGEIEKAVEVADKMSDNRVIEKLRYLTKDGGQKLVRETEVDSFWGTYIVADLDSDTKNYADRLLVTQVKRSDLRYSRIKIGLVFTNIYKS